MYDTKQFDAVVALSAMGYNHFEPLKHDSDGATLRATLVQTGAVRRFIIKSSEMTPMRAPLYGTGEFYHWMCNQKHEHIYADGLFYLLINKSGNERRAFVVPSSAMATYTHLEHLLHLEAHPNQEDSKMRNFRIPVSDECMFKNTKF